MFKVAPLSSSFMLVSMLGFIICAYFLDHPVLKSWAFAFTIVFILMFISAVISMSKTPLEDSAALEELAIHKKIHKK
ncbi:MAG: hypothetical protein ABIC91_03880 [Nanoarchaeota archaeon]|nr:hypothetical protein [Nanoarchaeota archaeon]MBU1030428.1 hypothetical protein [Nanoarchaeota archaeon]MBU1849789.1 hypothetical protein [Nanoarchaeota archaeon]